MAPSSPAPDRDLRDGDLEALAKASSLLAAGRFALFVFFPVFDVVTDIIFVISLSTSCVKTVLDADGLGHIFFILLVLSIFATLVGIFALMGVAGRALWFLRNRNQGVRLAAEALQPSGAAPKVAVPEEIEAGGAAKAGPSGPGEGRMLAAAQSESIDAATAAKAGPSPAPGAQASIWHAAKAFAVVHSSEVARPGPLSYARSVLLAQSLFEDAVQVGVTYALVAGMKSQDSATLISLYTSTAGLSLTVGTELWHLVKCCRIVAERKEEAAAASSKALAGGAAVVSPSPLRARSAGSAVAGPATEPPAEEEAVARSRSYTLPPAPTTCRQGMAECLCLTAPCVAGPMRLCCWSSCCRRCATSIVARLVIVLFVAALIMGILVTQQLSQYRSGVASLRADVSLQVIGQIIAPDGTVLNVRMPPSKTLATLPPFTSNRAANGNVSAREPGLKEPFGRITAQVHNQAILSVTAGLVLENYEPVGRDSVGCGLLWAPPDAERQLAFPEVEISKFIEQCQANPLVSEGYNIPEGACEYQIESHSAQAPYDPRPGVTPAAMPKLYEELFGEKCAQMTRNVNVTGKIIILFVGTCDLSEVV
ncbi:hypothetical protein FNF29_07754 [Cafeteria roenbergensis]|uniref:Uncharacterized protein n=1 Tax=Cafeteria roenbergensis TaxID=33653 RepID=A0A5A8DBK8_CAFRO|nr:hypothetical protein FNF29_07754 [Cafeteria roenbergensis]KAA0162962.1 hypothetical protein FNF31_03018 [Cafeteria roenbergensis]KAA0164149.1 hypothetical protein FNF28_03962 [Cafeteria roenbergensis]|eukprot:KAA0146873.1 hypothetical protein FNF29_07754 [Cafeteria roenbergensis]